MFVAIYTVAVVLKFLSAGKILRDVITSETIKCPMLPACVQVLDVPDIAGEAGLSVAERRAVGNSA